VTSEIAKLTDNDADWLRGWILYDADCALCRKWVGRFERTLTLRGFDFAALQSTWVAECFDIPEQELLARMRVLTRNGRDLTGADALVYIARHVWWAWPLYLLAQFPPAMPLFRRGYDCVARHRHCASGLCTRPL
jgi:predicted DCC family thiol-disulfide oxidoreductase YuxK